MISRRGRSDLSFHFVADHPEIGNVYFPGDPELGDIRYWRVKRFPKHIIFYRAITGGIEVVRVLHGTRDIEGVFRQNGP